MVFIEGQKVTFHSPHFSNIIDVERTQIVLQVTCNVAYSKSKALPLQAWSGPEGSRKLRFPEFMTTAQGGGKVVSLTHRSPLPPGDAPGTRFC